VVTGFIESRQGRSRESNKRAAIAALTDRLSLYQEKTELLNINSTRVDQIGAGLRGDKIRTYREKDNRVVNHENGKSARYRQVMNGNISVLWD